MKYLAIDKFDGLYRLISLWRKRIGIFSAVSTEINSGERVLNISSVQGTVKQFPS